MTLLVVPVVLGQGTRLFPGTGPDIALDLAGSRADTQSAETRDITRLEPRPYY